MNYPPLSAQNCSDCRYYRPNVQFATEGKCHRNSPHMGPLGGQWPRVYADDWCGDWCGREVG